MTYSFKLKQGGSPAGEGGPPPEDGTGVHAAQTFRFSAEAVQFAIAVQGPPVRHHEVKWAAGDVTHVEAALAAPLPHHDGGPVHFVIEADHGQGFKPYAAVPAQVKNGKATAAVLMRHPENAPGAPAPHPAAPATVALRVRLAPGVPTQPHVDVIPAGSVIAPPKKSHYVADMAAEKKWFARLEEKQIADLQPGDLLFYKLYDDANLIVRGQSIFTGARKGSKYSIHCQIYLGDGKVLSAEAQGLIANDVWPDCIVYRARDAARAASSAEVARFLVTKKIPYSTFHIFEQPIHDTSYGPVAKRRAQEIHRREVPVVAMMCSESATYCFQDNPDDPTIPLDATRLGPIHVEDYVNSHPDRFAFVGRIREAHGGATSSASEEVQAFNAIKVEAKADAQAAAHKVEKVAQQAKDLGKKAKEKLKHLL